MINGLAKRILEEEEYMVTKVCTRSNAATALEPAKLRSACEILEAAATKGKTALAFSGGADSTALLHLAAQTGIRPTVIWCDTRMEYPETKTFIERRTRVYGFTLAIVRARHKPIEQWRATGWPMLGKMAARNWTSQNPNEGFRLNVSECCRTMKIRPGRMLTRNLGCTVQITGQRGRADDRIRAMRAYLEGPLAYQEKDHLWIANPLTDWTDADVAAYSATHGLPEHPAKARGARTIGCVYCGGGSQYENSGYRVLRKTWPEAWRRFMVEWGGGQIILALKYRAQLEDVQATVRELGGIEHLAQDRPWLFDYTRTKPLAGYAKQGRA